jgi:flagellar protein FliL
MADEKDPPASTPAPAPSGTPKLIFVILLLALANAGGTAFLGVKVANATKAPPPAAHEPESPSALHGPTVTLEAFVVNLNEADSSRYLKTSLEVEMVNAIAVEEIARARPAVRDEVLRYLSSLSVEDTLGEEGKEKIQSAITARIDKVLGGNRVRRLFFTEFVVQ